ncbi:MAG: MATE family efflux transporter [Oscillospiraceae bacterium]|nr:MATE family efflux transporter [Oscillospiraceae bacterium]
MEKNREDRRYDLRYMAKISWPVFIEYGLGATVGLADTVMVSNLGSVAVSSVGLADSINMVFLMIYNAVATGTTVVVAQSHGAGDRRTIRRAVGQSTFFGVVLMLAVGALMLAFRGPLFHLLYPRVEAGLTESALAYMVLTSCSYPVFALFANLSGALRGIGRTRDVMIASVVINVANIALNAVFLYGVGMGVMGAALATLIGRTAGCIILIVQTVRVWGRDVFALSNMIPRRDLIGRIMSVSLPSGLDTMLFQAGKIIVSTFIGTMGTALISANTIAMSAFGIICIPGNALAVTGVTITGQCWGAERRRLARENLLKCCLFSVILLTLESVVLWFPAPWIIRAYSPEPDAFDEAVRLFRTLLVIIPLFWPTAFCSASGLRAADDVRFVTVISIVSMWVFRVGFAWVLGIWLGWGPFGVCLAMGLDWVCRSAFYMPRIAMGKKMRRELPAPAGGAAKAL